jgi:hypothetical protein
MKNKFLSILIILTVYFSSTILHSQVLNIDREGSENESNKKWMYSTNLSLSSDKNKLNLLDISSNIEIENLLKNNYMFIGLLNYNLTVNGSEVIQNEGYAQIRFRDNDKRNISNETYLQYQWNGTLGMEYRKLLGSNIRIKIFEKKDLDLYTGTGVFYEMEQWNYSGVKDIDSSLFPNFIGRNIFRLNHYWKGAFKINDNIDISGVSYFQLPIDSNFTNLRCFFDLNTNVKMTKNSSFVIHYDGTYDNYRVVPISKFYYSLYFGIQLKW